MLSEVLLRQYRLTAFRVANGFLRDYDEATDIASETILRLLSAKIQTPAAIPSFIRFTAHNLVVDVLRARGGHKHAMSLDAPAREGEDDLSEYIQGLRDPSGTPEEIALRAELARAVRDAMAQLPEHSQEILRLRFVEDLDVRETAARLNCHVGTVKSRTSRALCLLRPRLNRYVTG